MANSTTTSTTTNNEGADMATTKKTTRSAFDPIVRAAAADDGFNLSGAADIGLKTLVAATCGVVLYKTLKSDS